MIMVAARVCYLKVVVSFEKRIKPQYNGMILAMSAESTSNVRTNVTIFR